jgi:hypothetical protein
MCSLPIVDFYAGARMAGCRACSLIGIFKCFAAELLAEVSEVDADGRDQLISALRWTDVGGP